jgi:hypothetical protein
VTSFTELSGFGLSRRLFADFPMLKGIDVATLRAVPSPFLGVGIPFVNHLYNQMAVQTHRWLTVDILILNSLPHVLDPPFTLSLDRCNSTAEKRLCGINNNGAFPLDVRPPDRVEIPSRGEK